MNLTPLFEGHAAANTVAIKKGTLWIGAVSHGAKLFSNPGHLQRMGARGLNIPATDLRDLWHHCYHYSGWRDCGNDSLD